MAAASLLIVTGFETLEGFQLPMENRTVLWGLDQANIDWQLYNPWEQPPNLARYDAVLVTVYRAYNQNFAYFCKKFEDHASQSGIPVINTAANIHGLHSFYLTVWKNHGVPCARFQRFRSAHDLALDTYPLILRRDGQHRGGAMVLVHSFEEAKDAIERQHAMSAIGYPDLRGPMPLDLAVEFVETRKLDGYYCKWRSYVVGDEVLPAHFMRSRSPFVNYKDAALWAQTCNLDEVYRHEGEPHPQRLLEAAQATGFDIITLDYSVKLDGSYVFWEGNRVRATAGDMHVRWLGMREVDMTYGHAVARLVKQRIDASGRKPAARPRSVRIDDKHSAIGTVPVSEFVTDPKPRRTSRHSYDRLI